MDKIEIYTNETCPYCKQVKEKLVEEKIKFEEKSTENFVDEYNKIVNLVGIPTVPVIKYKDEYFLAGRDFTSPEHLINILEGFENSPYDNSRKTIEMLKTFNYNMGMAFANMNRSIKQLETKLNTEENEHKSTS